MCGKLTLYPRSMYGDVAVRCFNIIIYRIIAFMFYGCENLKIANISLRITGIVSKALVKKRMICVPYILSLYSMYVCLQRDSGKIHSSMIHVY